MLGKKKILYIITKSNFGGAQRYVYDLATSLPRETFDVAVAAGGDGLLKKKLRERGIKVIDFSSLDRDTGILKDARSFVDIFRVIVAETPDVIHLNSSKAGLLGAIAGRLYNASRANPSIGERGSKIVFTAHGWAFNEERPWWQKALIAVLSWFTVLLSHATIAVSDAVKEQICRMPFVKRKIFVIHNGIGITDFDTRENSRAFLLSKNTTARTSAKTVWIGTIAELHPTKGLNYAIEAMRIFKESIPDFVYVIIGDGEERESLQQLIRKNDPEEQVILAGFVENAARYLPAFDIFLLPSLSEGLSYALLEAGAAGLPVVASAVGGIPEIIENGKTGILVPPRDSTAIADILKNIAEDRRLQEQRGKMLMEKTKRSFSFATMLKKTIAIY